MKRRKNNKVEIKMVDKNAMQFMRTAQNLARKGKTNKKLHSNSKAIKYAI
jgi:PleD family two-component response regulator